MSHDLLTDLLRSADATTPPPPCPAGLARAVRDRARRRARRRRLAAAVLLPLAVLGACGWLLRPGTHSVPVAKAPAPTVAPDPAKLLAEASRLRAEATLRLTVVRAADARAQRRARAARAAEDLLTALPRDSVRQERDKAALTLLDHADRLRRDLNDADQALSAYRRTIELFPDSRWAAVARQRLERVTKQDQRRADAGPIWNETRRTHNKDYI